MNRTAALICIFSAIFLHGAERTSFVFAEGINVGVILPLTGKLAGFGQIEKKSFLLAVYEINKGGGINGTNIDLII